METNTVAAISTAMSPSGIGIVRISGEDSFDIIRKIFRGRDIKDHAVHHGYIADGDEIIDEVLVMAMKGPHSYTGEDTIEINCHGGVYVTKKVLETVLKSGAGLAGPGEFTKRAFLNGKMDLSQSEAVMDIITSENEYALQNSLSQLQGVLQKKIKKIRERILYHTAYIESALDDPEHHDTEGYEKKINKDILEIIKELSALLKTADEGRMVKEGIRTVIVGRPNAGKSSLLNMLAGEERAIVTDIEGTTRDILEETIRLKETSLQIIDTAGVRETDDIIEKIGVQKTKDQIRDADLILYIIDSSASLDENDEQIMHMIEGKKAIVLLNKSDLPMVIKKETMEKAPAWNAIISGEDRKKEEQKDKESARPVIEISAKTGYGMENLKKTIEEMFFAGELPGGDRIYLTNIRHKAAILEAMESLNGVIKSINNKMPEDFYTIDLMGAYEALGRITGETMGEDLINEIFSKFCMGK